MIITIPFWTSILVRTFAWTIILQREGIINELLLDIGLIETPLKLLYTWFSVYLGILYIMLPMAILIVYASVRRINENFAIAGMTLGASKFYAFRRLYFPLMLPALITSTIVVFVLTCGYFITPALLGGRGSTMIAMIIDSQMNQTLNWSFAAALSLVLLVVISLIVSLAMYLLSKLPMMREI